VHLKTNETSSRIVYSLEKKPCEIFPPFFPAVALGGLDPTKNWREGHFKGASHNPPGGKCKEGGNFQIGLLPLMALKIGWISKS